MSASQPDGPPGPSPDRSAAPGPSPAPAGILRRIAARRRERLAEGTEGIERTEGAKRTELAPPDRAPGGAEVLTPATNPFLAALARFSRGGRPAGGDAEAAVIAEIKMGSPRLGSLAGRVDPIAQARLYAEHGAAALSVVVEPDFFYGSYELLAACRAASGLPAIAKDFVVDAVQLRWARDAGADAVLLIAALYEPEELESYARQARALGLAPLVETHDADDLARLAGAPWELVGVNNRDLRTFAVDLERSLALLPALPAGAVKVAESGIRDALDVALLRDCGFDAFLVGESLLLAPDPGAKLRELTGAGSAGRRPSGLAGRPSPPSGSAVPPGRREA